MASAFQANPFNLLGISVPAAAPVHLPGAVEPRFEIAWNSFHQKFPSEVSAFFSWERIPKNADAEKYFRDCKIENRAPWRTLALAAAWEILFLVIPWPNVAVAPKKNAAFENTELTWSGPIEDFPTLNVPREAKKAAAKSATPAAAEETPAEEAFHPHQRIFTDPSHPTHPRQTLINPAAPPEAPKILPQLPNIVQLAEQQGPAKPRAEFVAKPLAHPVGQREATVTEAITPDLPNMEHRTADMSIPLAQSGPARPKLEINAGSAPRVAAQAQTGDAGASPEIASGGLPGGTASATLIALSANAGPAAPIVNVPQGNLSARVAMSPEGKPGASGNGGGGHASSNGGEGGGGSGAGKRDIGISISGGNPKPTTGLTGLSAGTNRGLSSARASMKRPDPNEAQEDPPARTGPPNFASLPPGAPPEQVFSTKRVYSMNVNMPNLNSVTGSWIIHFSELNLGGAAKLSGALAAPSPLRKVDPKYPATLIAQRIDGEVTLYAVIRKDGSVDSIQLVKGIDHELDKNAMAAFAQWKFQPASRDGQPVDLEAIVHIPFRFRDEQ